MFLGRYYHTLESKGRLSLPKKFREAEENWIITRGLDGGLFLFRAEEFADQLRNLPQRTFTSKQHRDFLRLMANEAQAVSVDANGRVQLPEYLIDFAHLQKEVVVVGSLSWVEIWDRTRYHTYLAELEPQAEEIAESLSRQLGQTKQESYV